MNAPRILIAGGGSGGHVTPGIAVAEALRCLHPEGHVHLACSQRPIDAQVLQDTDLPWTAMPAQPLRRSPRGLAAFVQGWIRTRRSTRQLLLRERIDAVLLLGGFVAGGVLAGSRVARVPTLMVNLDAVPGRANRWIARHADQSATAVPTVHPLKSAGGDVPLLGGVPVREAARPQGDAHACRAQVGLDPNRRTVLVTGASQGAASINALMAHLLQMESSLLEGWQVLHLAGDDQHADLQKAYDTAGIRARVEAFRHAMGAAWGAADLCIARAGASTVAEADFAGVPTVYLPYPWHKDRHQWHNAQGAVRAGRACIVDDLIDPQKTWPSFRATVGPLLLDTALAPMQAAATQAHRPDGAHEAAKLVSALAADSAGATSHVG
jgi:UDP-N-acetylglucosamine--N-acetylmuramyl-(pentapeptide) pyrophosphoryl-undecaprenol N-acetylglucosamine transferase